jgi:hypothetical protein
VVVRNCPHAAWRYGNDGPFGPIKAISRLRTVTMKRPMEPNGPCYTLSLT